MSCNVGMELYEHYQAAESARKELSLLRASGEIVVGPKEILRAKQRYVEQFANWLSHKAFCHDCKPKAPSRGQQVRSSEPGR